MAFKNNICGVMTGDSAYGVCVRHSFNSVVARDC